MEVTVENFERLSKLVEALSMKIENLEYETEQSRNLTASPLFDSGNTAWMLVATALVFMMAIPGLTLYYAGMAYKKHSILTVAMHSFTTTCLITLCWMSFGYSLTFSPASAVYGDYNLFFLVNMQYNDSHEKAPTIPEPLFCAYQCGFASVTAILAIGATAERMKYSSIIIFLILWHFLVYCPIAHANWSEEGFLVKAGIIDYAGGNVVHICAGFTGLATSIVIGKRHGFGEVDFTPANILHTVLGACFLWIGWHGFNGGSSFAGDAIASSALLNTQIAASAAAFSWITTEYFVSKQPSVVGMVNGAIAGLVSITPAAGVVDATGGFFIGLLSGPICYLGIRIKKYFGLDDNLDAFGLHGIAGVYGGFMTGLFARFGKNKGAFYGNPRQIGLQLYGIVVCMGWSFVMSFIILLILDYTIGLRVSVDVERAGLDRSLHGGGLYVERRKTMTPTERVAELLRDYAAAKIRAESKVEDEGFQTFPRFSSRSDPPEEDSELTNSDHGNIRTSKHEKLVNLDLSQRMSNSVKMEHQPTQSSSQVFTVPTVTPPQVPLSVVYNQPSQPIVSSMSRHIDLDSPPPIPPPALPVPLMRSNSIQVTSPISAPSPTIPSTVLQSTQLISPRSPPPPLPTPLMKSDSVQLTLPTTAPPPLPYPYQQQQSHVYNSPHVYGSDEIPNGI